MRKLKLLRPFQCDILVFDTIGVGWIHHCLPPNCTVKYLNIRNQLPFISSFRFYFQLIQRFIRQDKIIPGYRSFIWLSVLFGEINPRIIFTCADNNTLISRYALENPGVRVIYLQNALRDTVGSIPYDTNLPTYLALGKIEDKIFRSLGLRCRDYRPVGSVKLGLALAHYHKPKSEAFDLCFISHYRPELFSQDSPQLFKKIKETQGRLFKNSIIYASIHNLSLVVASKSREPALQDAEFDYFSSIAGEFSFKFTRGDKSAHEFDSYQVGLSSDLIIHPASTLGFELFAAGKKVLFGATDENKLITEWGIEHYFNALPNAVQLKSSSIEVFTKTCDHIRQMSTSQYHDLTADAAQSIVTMPKDEYPHEIVRRLLEEHLK